jgi:GTP-binding protein
MVHEDVASESPKSKAKGAPPAPLPQPKSVRVADAEFVAGAADVGQIPASAAFEEAPEIAFAGRSNVGKSSLLNMLLQRKGLARTSNTPGRTRQVNFFDVRLVRKDEHEKAFPPRIVFVDLPGYGYAKVSKSEHQGWKDLIEGYFEGRSALKALYVLVDIRRGSERDDEELIEYAQTTLSENNKGLRVSVVVTKMDKLPKNQQKPALSKLIPKGIGAPIPVIATSAETADGRDALWKSILSACRVT